MAVPPVRPEWPVSAAQGGDLQVRVRVDLRFGAVRPNWTTGVPYRLAPDTFSRPGMVSCT